MSTAIKVEDLSKVYHLGEIGTGTLSRDIERWWALLRGKEDPFLKLGESNDRTKKGESNIVYSLKDISFDIQQGDAVGVIGRNGAGKSTLLKILSRVTSPTKGNIYVKGRIASLLEVGTGFHPELTGRENIYLNGTILGMRKKEIDRRLDEIIDFSGIERYIDTPVKRYSSGMYVRLAFAVAAHLISEILIVDEVLAVGDAEFQKKCLGKMGEVSKGQGRTVLFVSHNMHMIQKLCNTCLYLKEGSLLMHNDTPAVIGAYLNNKTLQSSLVFETDENNTHLTGFVKRIDVKTLDEQNIEEIPVGRPWKVVAQFQLLQDFSEFRIAVGIITSQEMPLWTVWSAPIDAKKGLYNAEFIFEEVILATGDYQLVIGLSTRGASIQYLEDCMRLNISSTSDIFDSRIYKTDGVGVIVNPVEVNITKI
ncbi:MAG: ABC transporter ATP-binding protein [Bacteroidetes bacterium 43-93]|nr:ATP-binding cassette domain-containing protein [Bacteroidota bacterium]OJW97640.1 MAG: ABC transporter ATP-binding protein [Bacteroidetes bacterium 43-93]